MEKYGLCIRCLKSKCFYDWCPRCDCQQLIDEFSNWTSGNKDIDKFIQDTQRNATSYASYLEWIPYEKLENVKYLTKGGFGKVYIANWKDGERMDNFWDEDTNKTKRQRSNPIPVVIKVIDGFNSEIFISELKFQHQFMTSGRRFLRLYGVTKKPGTKEYGIITPNAADGNLKRYLKNNKISWQEKINFLDYIVNDLAIIHELGMAHCDVHSGNILINGNLAYLIDFGLCKKVPFESKDIQGVLPYIAPERLKRVTCTQSSDIYSLGIIMSELGTGSTPHYYREHDILLAIEILQGLRPEIAREIPPAYEKVMKRCWDQDPIKRPDIKKLQFIFQRWRQNPPHYILDQFENSKYHTENKNQEI